MKKYTSWRYILLGVCVVAWAICFVQSEFLRRASFEEPHLSPSVSYPSAYRPSSHVSFSAPTMPMRSVSSGMAAAPQATMYSTSNNVTSVPSSAPMRIYTSSSQRVKSIGGGGMSSPITISSGSNGSRGINYTQATVLPVINGPHLLPVLAVEIYFSKIC